jgi:hypothetical protein
MPVRRPAMLGREERLAHLDRHDGLVVLEAAGLVEAEVRVYYRLTSEGKARLEMELATPA